MHLFIFGEDKRLDPITDVVENEIIQVVEERDLTKLKLRLVYYISRINLATSNLISRPFFQTISLFDWTRHKVSLPKFKKTHW